MTRKLTTLRDRAGSGRCKVIYCVIALLFFYVSYPAHGTTNYVDASLGNNGYDGLSSTITNGHGPKLNIGNAISAASNGDVIVIASGFYQEIAWDPGANSLALLPQSQVTVYQTDPLVTDTDEDGIPDEWEIRIGSDPFSNDASAASTNSWAHGLTNYQVYQYPSVLLADGYSMTGDGLPDWWKVMHGLSVKDSSAAYGDADGDGYMNLQEYNFGTDPQDATSHPGYFPPDFAAWWKFDEGDGSNTVSAVGTNLTGILTGDPLPVWCDGVTSNALAFDGAQNEVVVNDDPQLTPTNALTITAWVKTATNMTSEVVTKWSTNTISGSYILSLTNGQVALELMLTGSYVVVVGGASSLSDTNWHHIAGTYDGSEMEVYLDGTSVGSFAASGTVDVVDAPLRLGLLSGQLDDVRLYNCALSTNAIAALYAADSDEDGMSDVWEANHGLNSLDPTDASQTSTNPFAHGLTNLQVYQNPSVVISNNYSTLNDGIPDWWRLEYFGSATTTNSSSCVSCTNTNPWAHGLTNLQVYQNPSILIADNYSTLGDGVADWWKVTYGFSLTDTSVADADPDGDGYSNLEEYLNGTNPFQYDSPVGFIVNGGQLYSRSLTVSILPLSTNYSNILISLDPSAMSNAALVANSGGLTNYTLPDNGDGMYELSLQYAGTQGQPHGSIFSKVVNVDRTPPVAYITSPCSTAVLNQAFITLRAVAADPNPVVPDAMRPLSIWINGQQFWDRDGTNIVIERFPVPTGTNSFSVTIQAVDLAGNTNQATQTWTVDSSTATNAPNTLTVNLSSTMLLPSVDSIWVEGDVDNAYALITAIVSSDSGDVTTNSLNVRESHYEGSVPLESGTNQVELIASDAAGNTSSNVYTLVSSTEFSGAITNPVYGVFATAPSNTVSGYVSALYDAGLPTQTNITMVTVNGVAAVLGTNIDADGNVPFWTTNMIPLGTPITAILGGPGIPTNQASLTPMQSQVYEVTRKVQQNVNSALGGYGSTVIPTAPLLQPSEFLLSFRPITADLWEGCWYPYYVDGFSRLVSTETQDGTNEFGEVNIDETGALGVFDQYFAPNICVTDLDPDSIAWPMQAPSTSSYTTNGPISRGLYFGTYEYDHGGGVQVFIDALTTPYCEGDCSNNPCVYTTFVNDYAGMSKEVDTGTIRFRAPREYGSNTTVIFTFEGMTYRQRDGATLNLSQVQFRGQSPVAYSNEIQSVSYWLTVNGGQEYTLDQNDFAWPSDYTVNHFALSDADGQPCPFILQNTFVSDWTTDMHFLSWTNFHNANQTLLLIYKLPTDDGRIDWTWVISEMNKISTNLVVKLVSTQPPNWQLGDMTNYKVHGAYQYEGTNYTHMWGIEAEGLYVEDTTTIPPGYTSSWSSTIYTHRVELLYEVATDLPSWAIDQGEALSIKNWSSVGIMHEFYHAVGLFHRFNSAPNPNGILFFNQHGSVEWYRKNYIRNRVSDFLKQLKAPQ